MNQEEHLKRIRARCVELLAIASKRTPGMWLAGYYDFETTRLYYADATPIADFAVSDGTTKNPDADFIAACASAAERSWRQSKEEIEWVLDMLVWIKGWREDNGCGGAMIQRIRERADAIISAWPEELL